MSQGPSYDDLSVRQVTREQQSVSSVAEEVIHMLQTAHHDARPHGFHTRTQPSKESEKTLGQGWPYSTGKRYFVSSCEKHQNELTFIIRKSNEIETVVMKDFTSCSFSWRLTHPNQVCRHIIWVLLYVSDVSCKSVVLFQLAYSDMELQTIVIGAPLTFSHLSVDLKCPIFDVIDIIFQSAIL